MHKVQSEDLPRYGTNDDDDEHIAESLRRLGMRLRQPGQSMTSPADVRNYCILHSAELDHEEFWVMFLDGQNCMIAFESMFRGTLTQTSVYPREVVKRALELNSAAVILSHNHPSGQAEPSRADQFLTTTLKQSLALIDVRVLDHVIVGGTSAVSFAERGLL